MCKQLGISHAAYYKWLHRTIPEQESENTKLAELIKEYDERFGHILGYRRMTSWINHFNHTSYSKNRVHRIMKKLGIHSIIRKKKKKYQSSRPETTAENKLKREFDATKPNEKWATDVTEFRQAKTFHLKPDLTLVIVQVGKIRTSDFCLHIHKKVFQSITPILNLSIEKAVDLVRLTVFNERYTMFLSLALIRFPLYFKMFINTPFWIWKKRSIV